MKKIYNTLHIMILVPLLIAANAFGFSEEEKQLLSNQATQSDQNKFRVPRSAIYELANKQSYKGLKSLFMLMEQKFTDDVSYEWGYLKVYEDFGTFNGDLYPGLLAFCNSWIEQDGSYVAFAARGFLISGEAARIRGRGYINTVSEENRRKSIELRRLANIDLIKSIELHPTLLPAYVQLITNYRNMSDYAEAQRILYRAIKYVPLTYYVRQKAINFEQPKWGGNYDIAQLIIDEAQPYGPKNPRLWNLRGEVYAMKAESCSKDSKCATKHYEMALQYGEKIFWINNLAYYYYKAGEYQKSIEAIKKIAPYTKNSKRLEQLVAKLEKAKDAKKESSPTEQNKDLIRYSDFGYGW